MLSLKFIIVFFIFSCSACSHFGCELLIHKWCKASGLCHLLSFSVVCWCILTLRQGHALVSLQFPILLLEYCCSTCLLECCRWPLAGVLCLLSPDVQSLSLALEETPSLSAHSDLILHIFSKSEELPLCLRSPQRGRYSILAAVSRARARRPSC